MEMMVGGAKKKFGRRAWVALMAAKPLAKSDRWDRK
jgi:hypothetical protein